MVERWYVVKPTNSAEMLIEAYVFATNPNEAQRKVGAVTNVACATPKKLGLLKRLDISLSRKYTRIPNLDPEVCDVITWSDWDEVGTSSEVKVWKDGRRVF